MRKLATLSLLVIYLYTGCKNSDNEADEYFTKQFDEVIGDDIIFFTSTINFLYYANPTNYWYPEENTYQDILDDKFRRGYRGLERLSNEINTIPDGDQKVSDAIKLLQKEISIAQQDIKEKQSAIENINGLGFFGGMSGIMDLSRALNSKEEQEKMEEKRRMPKEVEQSLYNLTKVLFNKYNTLVLKMNKLENGAFELTKPTFEEKSKIRNNLKILTKKKLNLEYNSSDTIIRDKMTKDLFDFYDKGFKLSAN